MVVFDTDLLIALSRNDAAAKAAYEKHAAEHQMISCFSWFELVSGICRTKDPMKHLRTVHACLGAVRIIHCDDTIATLAGKYVADQATAGKPTGIVDCFIAATCVVNDQLLITRNVAHFKGIPGLRVESW